MVHSSAPSKSSKPSKRRRIGYALLLVALLATLLDFSLKRWMTPECEADAWLAAHYPSLLTPAQLQAMYQTLITGYWVPQTGLFLSFPGTGDLRLVQQASTYDQGIAGLLLLRLGDSDKVKALLRFYERAWLKTGERSGPRHGHRGLANFYNAYYGVEGVEKTMHVGPNAWIGLLASRYYRKTGDRASLMLALKIADWIMYKVPHARGSVAMGEIPWNYGPWDKIHSTENNLSTYAFLSDLIQAPRLSREDRHDIETERLRIQKWLVQEAYDRRTGKILRGFHPGGRDTVGAIDCYTWYLSTLRPDFLQAQGIPVDHLMDIAGGDFNVKVSGFRGIDPVDQKTANDTYYDDKVVRKITDPWFLRPDDSSHRLIWYEGLAQHIVSLQDMARAAARTAFTQEGTLRRQQLEVASKRLGVAEEETGWMDQAAFHLPWGRVYPCATKGRFYEWGWPGPAPTPRHVSDALSPLVWRMFAGLGYEPMRDNQIRPRFNPVVRVLSKRFHDPGTDLLYGASEEMVVHAWELYGKKQYDLAKKQAEATIVLWDKDAHWLEAAKEKVVGGYLPYESGNMDQLQQIHNYWALNDVAAAYFIVGEINHQLGRYDQALEAFDTLLKNYRLAQIWDKRGWFWTPTETLQMEFASADEAHYGSLFTLISPGPSSLPTTGNDQPQAPQPLGNSFPGF